MNNSNSKKNVINVSSAFVKQLVSDKYHSAMINVYGEKYLKYREQWDSAIAGEWTPSHPLHVDLELFNACNYRCSFCPYSLPTAERPKGFNVDGNKRLSKNIIEKILKEANQRLLAVELGYNTEPLLQAEIVETIKLCKHYGVLDIRMGTNGSLLHKVDTDELIKSGLSQLQVSIDAIDNESYKRARQSDMYDQVVRNITNLVQRRDALKSLLPRLRVTYVMTPENRQHTDIFRKQWENIADIIGFQDLITYDDANLSVSSEGLKSCDITNFDGCYMPKVRMSVRSDGTIHPCCTVPGMKLRIGNVTNNTLEELWKSETMIKIRQSHFDGSWKKNLICKNCIGNTKE